MNINDYLFIRAIKYPKYLIGTTQENIVKFEKMSFIWKKYINSIKIIDDVISNKISFGLVDSSFIYDLDENKLNKLYGISMIDFKSHTFIVANNNNTINGIQDIKGKKISFGNKNSDSYNSGKIILNLYNITEEDIEIYNENKTINELVNDLLNNKFDVLYLNAQHPILDLNVLEKIKILDIEKYDLLKYYNLNLSKYDNSLFLNYYNLKNKEKNNFKYNIFFKKFTSSSVILICNKTVDNNFIKTLSKNIKINKLIPLNLMIHSLIRQLNIKN
tara:strand:+ start:127 stop:948 length:822 start_codon:yes stop_codon:yes gene_type:complete